MDDAQLIAPTATRTAAPGRPSLELTGRWIPTAATWALVGALVFVAVPRLIVQDTWLTLVSGREVIDHGLPSADHLTAMSSGRPWVDQQWLAQVLFYGANLLGGIKAVLLMQIGACLTGVAFLVGSAYRRVSSPATVSALAIAALAAAPWGLQVRAQGLALGFFGAILALLLRDPHARSRRTLLALPLLWVWANIHGSVVLGAILVTLYGALAWVRERDGTVGRTARYLALVVLPPVTLFASPYGFALTGYYRTMLISPPFAGYNVEWQRTSPSLLTATFFLLAALTLWTLLAKRSRLTAFDAVTLVVTLASALAAVRGIVWFALATLAILPPALRRDATPTRREALGPGAIASFAALMTSCVLFALTPSPAFTGGYPSSLAVAVADAAGSTGTVFADDRRADWLLWQLPSLRGRVAYDVRFELLRPREIARLSDYLHFRGARWSSIAADYRVVVGDWKHTSRVARLHGLRIVYNEGGTTVAVDTVSGRRRRAAGCCG